MKSKRLFAVLGVLWGVVSCTPDPSREILVTEIPPGTWSGMQPADVYYDNTDTLKQKLLSVLIRFRNDFSYDRLTVVLETFAPDSVQWRDTLSFPFAGASGITEAVSLTYTDVKSVYRSRSVLDQAGMYRFRFTPEMPETTTDEVIGVGIEITTE